ncbi:hypothetical protein Dimus_030941 [Dionaea muscipula]
MVSRINAAHGNPRISDRGRVPEFVFNSALTSRPPETPSTMAISDVTESPIEDGQLSSSGLTSLLRQLVPSGVKLPHELCLSEIQKRLCSILARLESIRRTGSISSSSPL